MPYVIHNSSNMVCKPYVCGLLLWKAFRALKNVYLWYKFILNKKTSLHLNFNLKDPLKTCLEK